MPISREKMRELIEALSSNDKRIESGFEELKQLTDQDTSLFINEGGIRALVLLLRSPNKHYVGRSLRLLEKKAIDESVRKAMIEANVVASLSLLLSHRESKISKRTAGIVRHLSIDDFHIRILIEGSIVAPLVGLLSDPQLDIRKQVLASLVNLSKIKEAQDQIISAGIVNHHACLLSQENPFLQGKVVDLCRSLACCALESSGKQVQFGLVLSDLLLAGVSQETVDLKTAVDILVSGLIAVGDCNITDRAYQVLDVWCQENSERERVIAVIVADKLRASKELSSSRDWLLRIPEDLIKRLKGMQNQFGETDILDTLVHYLSNDLGNKEQTMSTIFQLVKGNARAKCNLIQAGFVPSQVLTEGQELTATVVGLLASGGVNSNFLAVVCKGITDFPIETDLLLSLLKGSNPLMQESVLGLFSAIFKAQNSVPIDSEEAGLFSARVMEFIGQEGVALVATHALGAQDALKVGAIECLYYLVDGGDKATQLKVRSSLAVDSWLPLLSLDGAVVVSRVIAILGPLIDSRASEKLVLNLFDSHDPASAISRLKAMETLLLRMSKEAKEIALSRLMAYLDHAEEGVRDATIGLLLKHSMRGLMKLILKHVLLSLQSVNLETKSCSSLILLHKLILQWSDDCKALVEKMSFVPKLIDMLNQKQLIQYLEVLKVLNQLSKPSYSGKRGKLVCKEVVSSKSDGLSMLLALVLDKNEFIREEAAGIVDNISHHQPRVRQLALNWCFAEIRLESFSPVSVTDEADAPFIGLIRLLGFLTDKLRHVKDISLDNPRGIYIMLQYLEKMFVQMGADGVKPFDQHILSIITNLSKNEVFQSALKTAELTQAVGNKSSKPVSPGVRLFWDGFVVCQNSMVRKFCLDVLRVLVGGGDKAFFSRAGRVIVEGGYTAEKNKYDRVNQLLKLILGGAQPEEVIEAIHDFMAVLVVGDDEKKRALVECILSVVSRGDCSEHKVRMIDLLNRLQSVSGFLADLLAYNGLQCLLLSLKNDGATVKSAIVRVLDGMIENQSVEHVFVSYGGIKVLFQSISNLDESSCRAAKNILKRLGYEVRGEDLYQLATDSAVNLDDKFYFIDESLLTIVKKESFGGEATVYMGEVAHMGQVAVRVLHSESSSKEAKRKLAEEASMMQELSHPNVTRFLGFCRHKQFGTCMIMEFVAGGTLQKLIKLSPKALTESLRIRIALGIARGLSHMHSKNILHRDLKSDNVLLTKGRDAVITDFGLSKRDSKNKISLTSRPDWSPRWCAPERLCHKPYTNKADVFSLAVIAWEMVSLRVPWLSCANGIAIYEKVVEQKKRPHIPKSTPVGYADFIQKCWAQRPEHRPTAEEVSQLLVSLQTPSVQSLT